MVLDEDYSGLVLHPCRRAAVEIGLGVARTSHHFVVSDVRALDVMSEGDLAKHLLY